MQPNNDEAIIPEEDAKLPAKRERPRRKAALKSEEKMMEQAAKDEADDKQEKVEDKKVGSLLDELPPADYQMGN